MFGVRKADKFNRASFIREGANAVLVGIGGNIYRCGRVSRSRFRIWCIGMVERNEWKSRSGESELVHGREETVRLVPIQHW